MSIRMDIAMFFYNFLRFWAIMGSNEGQEGRAPFSGLDPEQDLPLHHAGGEHRRHTHDIADLSELVQRHQGLCPDLHVHNTAYTQQTDTGPSHEDDEHPAENRHQ